MNIKILETHLKKFVYEIVPNEKVTNFRSEKIPSDFSLKILDTDVSKSKSIKIGASAKVSFAEATYLISGEVVGEFIIDATYLETMGKSSQDEISKKKMDKLVEAIYNILMERIRIYSGLFSLEPGKDVKVPPLEITSGGIQQN